MNQPRWLWPLLVVALLAVFAGRVITSMARQSATYDETTHLPAGYSYLRWGDYRLNPEHPPLAKMLGAAPLLALRVSPASVEPVAAPGWSRYATTLDQLRGTWAGSVADNGMQWHFGHLFLYGPRYDTQVRHGITNALAVPTTLPLEKRDFINDADRLLFWGRMPVVGLGIGLGVLIFFWARALFSDAAGILALALFTADPNFIAHSGLVTTDVAISFFLLGTFFWLWRASVHRRWGNALGAALFAGLAFGTKFSAIVLLPATALLGLWHILRNRQRGVMAAMQAAGMAGVLAAAGLLSLWALYGFRFSMAKDAGRDGHPPLEEIVRQAAATVRLLDQFPAGPPVEAVANEAAQVRLRFSDRAVLFAARHHLVPEAALYGYAFAEMKSHLRASFLRGQYSVTGFRSYFLWAFLYKTPLVALLAMALALMWAVWRRVEALVWLGVPVVVYLGVAMLSNLNIGHRHILPVYPFLMVLAGGLAIEWQRRGQNVRRATAIACFACLAIGSFFVLAPPWKPAVVHPHYLAYFNELAGGPRGGTEILVDSNLDWGQDLPGLRQWLDEHHITEPIGLCYFGTADPLYHGIRYCNLPGGYPFAPPAATMDSPYVVISATNLKGVYFSPEGRAFWQRLLQRATLVDTIGYSLFIYRLDRPIS